jgi:hypothetical protein
MLNERTKILTTIIKKVGINGLLAIKNDYKRSTEKSIYSSLGDSLGFTAQYLIFHHLTMVKDFKQYN